ncbi:MAG: hypothetical protein KBT34_08535 [Prevotella sp.]|nr:hypothetical protein [Candidatus Prevotella equi]
MFYNSLCGTVNIVAEEPLRGIIGVWILSTRILFAFALVWGKKAMAYFQRCI